MAKMRHVRRASSYLVWQSPPGGCKPTILVHQPPHHDLKPRPLKGRLHLLKDAWPHLHPAGERGGGDAVWTAASGERQAGPAQLHGAGRTHLLGTGVAPPQVPLLSEREGRAAGGVGAAPAAEGGVCAPWPILWWTCQARAWVCRAAREGAPCGSPPPALRSSSSLSRVSSLEGLQGSRVGVCRGLQCRGLQRSSEAAPHLLAPRACRVLCTPSMPLLSPSWKACGVNPSLEGACRHGGG